MDRLAFSVSDKIIEDLFFLTCRLKGGISSMPQELHQNRLLSSHWTNELLQALKRKRKILLFCLNAYLVH